MIQKNDQNRWNQKAWRIKNQVSTILSKWGLLPRFKRWRLTQDPDTGMVVLFGILNNSYIATHTSIPFSNYFDPRLLRDLTSELQVRVVAGNTDGLRYAFILDRGSLGKLPTHIAFPFLEGDNLFVRVVHEDEPLPEVIQPQIASGQTITTYAADDHMLVRQGMGVFSKVFDDIKVRNAAAAHVPAQKPPNTVVIDEGEFNKRVAEHEANRQRHEHIRRLFGSVVEEQR